jgi:hypothetical protein
MTAKTINVRLPEALYNQIEELAKATARTKSKSKACLPSTAPDRWP